MPNPNISAVLNNANKNTIIASINSIKALMPFLVNLDPATRQRLRKTGTKREGYVTDVYNGAIANPGVLPPDFQLSEWTKDENLTDQLKEVLEVLSPLFEGVDDTVLLLGNERIKQADAAYGYMKIGAKGNSALTELVNRIAKQFAGQGREGRKTTFTIPGGAQVTVTDVVTSTQLINIGTVTLKVYKGSSAIGTAQTVGPGEGLTLESDATTITVVNEDVTATGVFTVKLKPKKG